MTFIRRLKRDKLLTALAVPFFMVHGISLAQSFPSQEVAVASDIYSLFDGDQKQNTQQALVSLQTDLTQTTGSIEPNLSAIEDMVTNLAYPAGSMLDCRAIVQSVRSNRSLSKALIQQLHASLKTYADEESSAECRCIAELVVERLLESQIRDALKAHTVIVATTAMANEQIVSLQRIDELQQRQQIAIENGLSIRDASAIDRLRLKVIDSVYQNRGLNQNARGQLAILTNSQTVCNYLAVYENCPSCDASDLCSAIQTAESCRADLQALQAIDHWLCNENANTSLCETILGHSLFGLTVAHSGSSGHPILNLLRGRNIRQERIESLRSVAQASYKLLRDKVTSEVTDAWYRVQTNRDRLMVAELTRESTSQRLEQLRQLGNEVGATADELIQADLQEREAAIDVVLRQQELHLAEIELAYAIGQL